MDIKENNLRNNVDPEEEPVTFGHMMLAAFAWGFWGLIFYLIQSYTNFFSDLLYTAR